LTERDDTAGQLELVTNRIAVTDEAEELTKLFYEQARLFRAQSDLDGALGALENLLMLDSEHVAGLALSAEIHTAKEDWQGAVAALRDLAQTDIPGAQRKLARLGAADYLENKLGDAQGALDELLTIETEGLAGPAIFVRMAKLYEKAGKLAQCVRSLRKAADETQGKTRAEHLRQAGKLLESNGDRGMALQLFREVQALVPTDLPAAEALARLTDNTSERQQQLLTFENAVRAEVTSTPDAAAPYRKLRASARLRSDADLELRAASSLAALGLADATEVQWLAAHITTGTRLGAGSALGEGDLESLWSPSLDSTYHQLALPVWRAAVELDRLEPSRFGVGRSDRVSPK